MSNLLTRIHSHSGLIVGIVLLAGLFGAAHLTLLDPTGDAMLEKYANEIIQTCSKESYPPSCYDREIPLLMDTGVTLEQAFAVTSKIQNKVPNYFYCHVLGHNLSAKETAKDPSQWTKVVARCPTGMCSNGCLHGSAQERFRDDALTDEQIHDLIPDLKDICVIGDDHRNFTGLEQASCFHALGHLSMYISGADIAVATNVCDQIAVGEKYDYRQTCYEGSYMQIFQPLEPEDFALVEHIPAKTIEEAELFCDSFSGEYRAACHRESWPLYRESLSEAEGMNNFCSLVNDPVSIQRCYNAMFYVMTAQFSFDQTKITRLCEGFEDKRKAQCFANAASRMVETDYRLTKDAIAMCGVAEQQGVGARCYDELLFYSSFNFHEGSEAFTTLCRSLPEPWRTSCLAGEGRDTHPSANDY